jgi:hypothetical protein
MRDVPVHAFVIRAGIAVVYIGRLAHAHLLFQIDVGANIVVRAGIAVVAGVVLNKGGCSTA